ncbi:MAG: amidohydrolase [Flavobacteriales bacterium]
MYDLTVAVIQSEIIWEDIEANLKLFGDKIDSIEKQIDLIVLPEMFTTGFSMNTGLAEEMDGKTVKWIIDKAKAKNCCIMGSVMLKENGAFYNRMLIAKSDGEILTYDKRHLFTFAGEQNYYSRGEKQVTFELKNWKICPLICYDLRFPVWSRNTSEIDLYIYVANWPEVRKKPWSNLLISRAIENISYVVGVNRIGLDGTDKNYSGNSAIIDYKGDEISQIPESKNHIEILTLSKENLNDFRAKFPALSDGDLFKILNK